MKFVLMNYDYEPMSEVLDWPEDLLEKLKKALTYSELKKLRREEDKEDDESKWGTFDHIMLLEKPVTNSVTEIELAEIVKQWWDKNKVAEENKKASSLARKRAQLAKLKKELGEE